MRLVDRSLQAAGIGATQMYLDALLRLPSRPRTVGRLRQIMLNLPSTGDFCIRITEADQPFVYCSSSFDSFNLYCRMQFVDYEPVTRGVFRRIAAHSRFTLDIGAYSGLYSLEAARANNLGRVWAFEPMDIPRALLVRNVEVNALGDRVTVHSLALSDCSDTVSFYLNAEAAASTRASILRWEGDEVGRTTEVNTRPLDSMQDDFPSRADLVKIDVEGAEELVLRGAASTLAEDRPVLFTEALSEEALGAQSTLMAQFGYGDPLSVVSPFESDDRNYVWVHPQRKELVLAILGPLATALK